MGKIRFITTAELLNLRDEDIKASDEFSFFANIGYTRGVESRIYCNAPIPMAATDVARALNDHLASITTREDAE